MNLVSWLQVIQIGLTIVTIIIVPFFKWEISKLYAADAENKKQIEKLSQKLTDTIEKMALNYVNKTEYLKTSSEIFIKLDGISKILYELNGEFKQWKERMNRT